MSAQRKDELLSLVKMLLVALLACTTVHHVAGCSASPAFVVGAACFVASDNDFIPMTESYSTAAPPPEPGH